MQKLVKTLGILILLIAAMFLSKIFINTDFFRIKEVAIDGKSSNLIQGYITEKIKNLKEQNIVYLNTSEIEKLLEQDVRIKKIKIRKIYPSKLRITLEERTPYVYIKDGNNIYLADEEFNMFGNINEAEIKNLPIVIYDENDEVKKDLKNIVSKIKNKDLYNIISEIRKGENDYDIIFNNGVRMITDTLVSTEDYDKKYRLYEQEIKKQQISYIDIRFEEINVK